MPLTLSSAQRRTQADQYIVAGILASNSGNQTLQYLRTPTIDLGSAKRWKNHKKV